MAEVAHPKSLKIFFLTEMWERYGFYVVQTLLILYLSYYFHWKDVRAFELVGSFTAMTYIASLMGGWIADHLTGQKIAILTATIILFFSYVALAFLTTRDGLLMSLAGICVGTGLLKPNISSLLGHEYPPNSPNREGGFMFFYIGITSGIILASTLPNLIRKAFGWHMAFLSAALVMLFAFAIFLFGIKHYRLTDYHPTRHTVGKGLLTGLLISFLYIAVFEVFNFPAFANSAFTCITLLCVGYIFYSVKVEVSQQARQNVVIGLLCFISALFWAFNFQMFSSFSLLITRLIRPTLFGIHFPAPYYVAIQSFGLIMFGLLMARPKAYPNINVQAIHICRKFSMAMFLMAGAYLYTTLILYFHLRTDLLSPLFIVPIYLTIAWSEILLSPVGLSAITLLSSPHRVSTMMGIFFVSLGVGGFLSGKIATLAAIEESDVSLTLLSHMYVIAFSKILALSIIAALLCFALCLLIQKLLRR